MKPIAVILFFFAFSECFAQNENTGTTEDELVFQSLFNTQIQPGIACFRIPSLITAPNGDLIAAIDARVPSCYDLKLNKDINIVIRRSMDNGNTWSSIETVVDYPYGQSASDPSMIVDAVTGEIFMFFNFMDLENEIDVYYLKFIKSEDNGKSWTAPRDITSQISKPAWHHDFKFITSGRGIQTRSGKLLHTLVNLEQGLHLFYSDDHGNTWAFIDTPIKPANESKVVELADGSWMINSRVEKAGIRYVHTSSDEGKTWVTYPDSILIDPSCNASLLRYSLVTDSSESNRLIFSNANTQESRENMTVQVSYDEGASWTQGKTIYAGSSAYSSLCVLANGDIGLFFEKDNYTDNVFVRFTLDWLTAGEGRRLENK